MNNVAVQNPQVVAQPASSQSTAQNASSNSSDSTNFLNLLTEIVGANGEATLAMQLKQDAETLGTQMNAEMLAINPLLGLLLSGQIGQADSTALQQSTLLDALNQTQSLSGISDIPLTSELLSQLQDILDTAQTLPSADTVVSGFAAALKTATAEDSDADATAITAVFSNSGSDESSILQGQSLFDRAVSQAQQLIKSTNDNDTSDIADLDFEELQKKVDSGTFLSNLTGTNTLGSSDKIDQALDPQNIFDQIKSSVATHVQDGDTDFTIKLSPEGLGEITVKLSEESGKVTLTLAASDTNVQRLLGSELTNLRDIMRPYNVEVAQVVQSNEAQNMDMQQQLQQQFSQHSYTGHQQATFLTQAADYSESAEIEESPQAVILPDSVLNTYI